MEHPSRPQLDLFDADAELSAIGVTRRQLVIWWDQGLLSFDPGSVARLERWMYQEIAFLYHVTKVEPSVNALRKLLAPLKRPYIYDLNRSPVGQGGQDALEAAHNGRGRGIPPVPARRRPRAVLYLVVLQVLDARMRRGQRRSF